MNVNQSVERLSDSVRKLIAADPTVSARISRGEVLPDILSSAEWAEDWKRQCRDFAQIEVLKGILVRYGAQPFELESLSRSLEEASDLAGADIRVAVAKLRRSGVLYAVRKAWGDRLIYLPEDGVALWQPHLFPAEYVPLAESDSRGVVRKTRNFRLPLALEMLSAWQEIERRPIERTAKGSIHRADMQRLIAHMRLTPEELACLPLSYPDRDQLPPQAALALDLGLCCGVLCPFPDVIGISKSGLEAWLSLSLDEADIRLQELIMTRYCSAEPALHLALSSMLSLKTNVWHLEGLPSSNQGDIETRCKSIALLESFGWLERGDWQGSPVFRRKSVIVREVEHGSPFLIVQPDGEILAPPEIGMRTRWTLSQISENVTADAVFIYRLTKRACENAYRLGYTLQSAVRFLERESRKPLPEPVLGALEDWFSALGRTRLTEVTLLRTESIDIAEALLRDPELRAHLVEQVGDKDFIIDASSYKRVSGLLRKAGYPPLETKRIAVAENSSEKLSDDENKGWIRKLNVVSVFESDRTLPVTEDLFPGLDDIPAAWVTRPRRYHHSTSKEIVRRAIEWKAQLHLEHEGKSRLFIPTEMLGEGPDWTVKGRWRSSPGDGKARLENVIATVGATEIAEIMIALPQVEELETD
ncbi:helicase-associated domain-containing protein [Cohnella terricola]|uniref:helicase-associated domain-containing protein n=1 Tax=Cohnella terricola TaxID=1289167 RepID=UPI0016464E9C|nr:helicase-associated domain-containing protein [Cohnella terricola]